MVQEIEGKIPNPLSRRFFPCRIGGIQKFSLGCYDHVRYVEAVLSPHFIFSPASSRSIYEINTPPPRRFLLLSVGPLYYMKTMRKANVYKSCPGPTSNYL